MARERRFRIILPIVECGFAALFGGIGLWQRSAILSRPFVEGETLWNSTARFHVWPWPYKFATVSNMPAFMAGSFLSLPIAALSHHLPEFVELASCLLCASILWYWVGSRFDLRWTVTDNTPWIALVMFTLVSLGGAFIPMGYVGYVPYGLAVWTVAFFTILRCT